MQRKRGEREMESSREMRRESGREGNGDVEIKRGREEREKWGAGERCGDKDGRRDGREMESRREMQRERGERKRKVGGDREKEMDMG